MSDHKEALGRAIRAARGAMTHGEFAFKCGLSTASAWRYENAAESNRVPCRPGEIDKLADAGVPRPLLYAAAHEAGCLVIDAEAMA